MSAYTYFFKIAIVLLRIICFEEGTNSKQHIVVIIKNSADMINDFDIMIILIKIIPIITNFLGLIIGVILGKDCGYV